MRHRLLALASAVVLLSFSAAEAKTLASPPTYGGRSQSGGGFANCRVFNGGPSTVTITRTQIISSSNALVPLTSNSCSAGLGSGQYCAFSGSGAGNVAFSCRLDVSGPNVALVRAVMEVTNSTADILNALPAQ